MLCSNMLTKTGWLFFFPSPLFFCVLVSYALPAAVWQYARYYPFRSNAIPHFSPAQYLLSVTPLFSGSGCTMGESNRTVFFSASLPGARRLDRRRTVF